MSAEVKKNPTPPPKNKEAPKKLYLEKYFDPSTQLPYFYNPQTGESLWEAPTDATIADLTSLTGQ